MTGAVTGTDRVVFRSEDPILEPIADYLLNRADALVNNQPGLIRFLRQDGPDASASGPARRHFNLTAEDGTTVIDGGVAHQRPAA